MAQKVDENGDPVLDENGNPVEEDQPEAPQPVGEDDPTKGAPDPVVEAPLVVPEVPIPEEVVPTVEAPPPWQGDIGYGPGVSGPPKPGDVPYSTGAPGPVTPGTPGLPAGTGFGVYTVALPGGGEMRVDATDAASAIANAGGGGSVVGFQGWQGGAPEGRGIGRADTGGMQPDKPLKAGRRPRTILLADGKPFSADLSDAELADLKKDQEEIAASNAQAKAFAQGIEQQKIDLQKLVAAQNDAYNKALQQYHDTQLAQQAAQAAAQQEFQRQELALRQDMQRRGQRPRRMAAVAYR